LQQYLFNKLIPVLLSSIFGVKTRNHGFGGVPEFISPMGCDAQPVYAVFIVKSVIFMSLWTELFRPEPVYPDAADQPDA
jgi:hypothetical protein